MLARDGAAVSALSPATVSFARGVCVTTPIDKQIAQELGVRPEQVAAAVALLDDGATVPFVARYRKEGKLDDALEAAIRAADSKGRLEDIYLPFKPKRRTKAEIAKEAGLELLAELLLTQPQNDPQAVAAD